MWHPVIPSLSWGAPGWPERGAQLCLPTHSPWCLSSCSIPSLQQLLRGVCLPIASDHHWNDTSEACSSPTGALWEAEHLQALAGSCRAPHNPICTWLSSAALWALSFCCRPGPRLCVSAGSHASLPSIQAQFPSSSFGVSRQG